MIFEDQQHQKECVASILESLAGIEFSSDCEEKIGLLRENINAEYKKFLDKNFSEKSCLVLIFNTILALIGSSWKNEYCR
ncbi:MAG: hypothetical protein ACNYPH_03880 [Gammaproteobacteria bacterium WSBS_2016_MAG_OTU1]